MKKLFTLTLVTLFAFTTYGQTPGSIKNNVDGKVYFDQSPGQISEEAAAIGYGTDNADLYYSWEYGVEGETMTVITTTKSYLGGVEYDGDGDGVQDTDANGTPLFYDSSSFLNIYDALGTEFGGKTVTYTRYANDKTGTVARTSSSTTIEVMAEKKPVAGKISTTQNYVRETANIDLIVSDIEASEGKGSLTYTWEIGKLGSFDVKDLGISTADCDLSAKTFADFGMVAGDVVKITRYATDELGTKVSAGVSISLLSSVAYTAPTDSKYIVTATIQENGPRPDFKLINGDMVKNDLSNLGVKLITVNIGGFRNPKYVLAAELAPGMRRPVISDVTYSYVSNEKYDIKYSIDPVAYTYSLAVKHVDSTSYVTLAKDQTYYAIGGNPNNIQLTHYDPKNMKVTNFKVAPIQSISLGNVPTDAIYKFSATIQGGNRAKLYLLNNEDGFTDADIMGFSNVGPNLLIEQGNVFLGTKTGIKSILGKTKEVRMNNVFSDSYEPSDVTVKFDIEYLIDPINHTYSFKIKENGSADDFTTIFENKPFFFKQQADDSFVYNEFNLTHYQASRLTVENVKVQEVQSFALNVPEPNKNYTFTATVTPVSARNAGLFLLSDNNKPSFLDGKNMGPVVSFNRTAQIVSWEGWSGRRPVESGTDANFAWELNKKYDVKFDIDINDFIYTLSVKNEGEDDSKYVVIVENQGFYYVDARGVPVDKENTPAFYYMSGVKVENAMVKMASSDAKLSDLTIDGVTVVDFSSDKLTYDVELADGTTTVPTVVATTLEANAFVSITDATSIPGTTIVEVTAADGATKLTYTINFTNTLGIDDVNLVSNIYPNPTTGIFNVEANSPINSVEVYNVSGTLVKVYNVENLTKVQLNISSLDRGVYLVKVNTNNTTQTTRIIKK